MRPTLSSLSARIPSVSRPAPEQRRPAEEKASTPPRPQPKRCLNEAAHKLDR